MARIRATEFWYVQHRKFEDGWVVQEDTARRWLKLQEMAIEPVHLIKAQLLRRVGSGEVHVIWPPTFIENARALDASYRLGQCPEDEGQRLP